MATSELSEQIQVVRKLKAVGILFCAVPNGGFRHRGEAVRLRQSGVQAGVPDLLVFDPPPGMEGKVGTALEMKREGMTKSSVSVRQKEWLDNLEERGWVSLVAFGWRDAIKKLTKLGYEIE
jgi:hypothetical protein